MFSYRARQPSRAGKPGWAFCREMTRTDEWLGLGRECTDRFWGWNSRSGHSLRARQFRISTRCGHWVSSYRGRMDAAMVGCVRIGGHLESHQDCRLVAVRIGAAEGLPVPKSRLGGISLSCGHQARPAASRRCILAPHSPSASRLKPAASPGRISLTAALPSNIISTDAKNPPRFGPIRFILLTRHLQVGKRPIARARQETVRFQPARVGVRGGSDRGGLGGPRVAKTRKRPSQILRPWNRNESAAKPLPAWLCIALRSSNDWLMSARICRTIS